MNIEIDELADLMQMKVERSRGEDGPLTGYFTVSFHGGRLNISADYLTADEGARDIIRLLYKAIGQDPDEALPRLLH